MQSYDIIMKEHILIIKMLNEIKRTLENATKNNHIDPYFVDTVVDFIRFYADRTHHGKEEDILFKKLKNKNLSNEDLNLMDELIQDHSDFRSTTNNLVEANKRYRNKEINSLNEVILLLKTLIKNYPEHVKKESNVFFPATINYFSEGEHQEIMAEFKEFDRTLIHEKYQEMVREVETKNNVQ